MGTWLGGLALVVQVLLPLLLGAEICCAGPDGTFGAPAVARGSHVHPRPADHHTHDGSIAGCPICLALAAAQGIAPTAAPILPVAQGPAAAPATAFSEPRPAAFPPISYQARAPPTAG